MRARTRVWQLRIVPWFGAILLAVVACGSRPGSPPALRSASAARTGNSAVITTRSLSESAATLLPQIDAAGAALRRNEPWALEALVELAVAQAEDREVRSGVWRATESEAPAFFAALWSRSASESRPLEVLVREASRQAIRGGEPGTLRRVVGEIWARECCMRRSYLAAALEGVADGLELVGEPGAVDVETRRELAGLSEHHDPDVAAGASRAATLLGGKPTAPR